MLGISPFAIALVGSIAAICLYRYSLFKTYALPLPPGPKTSWLGQVELPKSHSWLTYARWREIYGDMIYIHILGNPILVLNSAEVVNELLEKRSANYSSRPVRTMVTELMGWSWLFSVMPYGSWWRRHRALFHQYFHPNASTYHTVSMRQTHTFLRNLMRNPDDFAHYIRRTAAAIVMDIAYGHEVAEEGDEYVTLADKALAGLGQAGLWGTYMVDYLPFLKHIPSWLPGADFQRTARDWRKSSRDMVNLPFNMVKDKMTEGTAKECFVTLALGSQQENVGSDVEHEELVKDVAAIIYAGGADTMVSTIKSFFLCMVLNPDIQIRAQADIDRVVGPDRLPLFSDRPNLAFIDCLVWECLRWNPVTPLGIAHYVSDDDEYKGYRIPKGTTVLPNVWGILHDPTVYPDPFKFNPERFLNQNKDNLAGCNDPPDAAFGFGRRMCPGRWLAFDTIWLVLASTLSVYNISKAVDANGRPIEPDMQYTNSILSHPKPFKCHIVPRSGTAAALIKQTEDELFT